MTKTAKFECGCEFLVENQNHVVFDTDSISLDCRATWALIGSGNTKGCFQLESRLGQSMAKKLKPSNMEELSALISILRPGCLEAIRDGKSVSYHYIDKKNGNESVDYFHPALEDILKSTYGEMVYQEQAMQIAQKVAGFNLQEADELRKSIGKKNTELMAKVKLKFIEGSKKLQIVSDDQAEQIFGWIEKSQRYSFNKSHAISYAFNAYLSAFAKAHFPLEFFCSYLKFAKDKIDPKQEIKELIQNAKSMHIIISPPDIRLLNKDFIIHNNQIYFGLTSIKGVGESIFNKLTEIVKVNKPLKDMSFCELLFFILRNLNKTAASALIWSGATDSYRLSRTEQNFYLESVNNLTDKECDIILSKYLSINKNNKFQDLLKSLINDSKVNKKRKIAIQELILSIQNPPYKLVDSTHRLSDIEMNLLGIPISFFKTDDVDSHYNTITCNQTKTLNPGQKYNIIGEISQINITKTKTGKNPGAEMSFVEIFDSTGSCDSIIFFPEQYQKFKDLLNISNILMLKGKISGYNNDGFIVEDCVQLDA
jgi:DNA polymerase-3 subunit alpha